MQDNVLRQWQAKVVTRQRHLFNAPEHADKKKDWWVWPVGQDLDAVDDGRMYMSKREPRRRWKGVWCMRGWRMDGWAWTGK